MTGQGIEIYIRQTNRETIGQTSRWSSLTLTQRRNDVGRWSLVLGDLADAFALSPQIDSNFDIVAPRGVIIRRDGVTLASGWADGLANVTAQGSRIEWTVAGFDDTILLADATCWPKPSAAVTAQTDDYHVLTGPASNRVKGYFDANVITRQAIPGASSGSNVNLGPSGTSKARFDPLLELAQKLCARAVNFRVMQRDSDNLLKLDFSLPNDLTTAVQFSPELGSVTGWSFTSVAPQATRAIVGAGGEGKARAFRQYTNTVDEAAYGGTRKPERFLDRRDLDPAGADFATEMAETGNEFLTENAGRHSFKINATDVPGARYGIDYLVGDKVRGFATAGGVPIDDLVEEVTVTWTPDGGERAEVWIGPKEDPQEQTRKQARLLRRRLSALEARQ